MKLADTASGLTEEQARRLACASPEATQAMWARVQRVRCANGGGHHRYLRRGDDAVLDIGPCVHFPDVTR